MCQSGFSENCKLRSYAIAARVSTKLSRKCNSCTEEEQDVKQIQGCWDEFVDCEFLLEADRNEVEEREQGEHSDEHSVVDHRWVSREGGGDDVANQPHNYNGEGELHTGQKLKTTCRSKR